MLKLLSSSAFRQMYHPTHLASPLRAATESLSSISGEASWVSGFSQKAFFCSEAGDGSNSDHGLNEHATVLVVPNRPLFPLLHRLLDDKDPFTSALLERYKLGQAPYACVSLLKDRPGTDPGMNGAKGKEIFDRLHKVGTLAKIGTEWYNHRPYLHLTGLRRVRITEMVGEDPLTVKVDHLKDLPFNKDDPTIKTMFSAVKSGLKDFFVNEHRPFLFQLVDKTNIQELASFGAGLLMANKYECQAILEELDVHERLKQTLKLLHRTTVERKIFREKYNRRYAGKEIEQLVGYYAEFYAGKEEEQLAGFMFDFAFMDLHLGINTTTTVNKWLIDFGVTRNICADKSVFVSYTTSVGDGEKHVSIGALTCPVLGKGMILLKLTSGNTLILDDVLHVPSIRINVISLAILLRYGVEVTFESDKIIMTRNNKFVGKGDYDRGFFVLDFDKALL